MTPETFCWIVVGSLVIPAVLAVLLRRTAAYWLPSALLLVHAAAAFVLSALLMLVPDLFLANDVIRNWLFHGIGIALAFAAAMILSSWAAFVAGFGAIVAIATGRWRVRQRLPTRFGATWPVPRSAHEAAPEPQQIDQGGPDATLAASQQATPE
jgi:hypothetical protein